MRHSQAVNVIYMKFGGIGREISFYYYCAAGKIGNIPMDIYAQDIYDQSHSSASSTPGMGINRLKPQENNTTRWFSVPRNLGGRKRGK